MNYFAIPGRVPKFNLPGATPQYRQSMIIESVATYFNVSFAEIKAPGRKAHIVWPRHVLMYLLLTDLHMTLNQVGAIMGGRDHTTVMFSRKAVKDRMETNEHDRNDVRRIQSMYK